MAIHVGTDLNDEQLVEGTSYVSLSIVPLLSQHYQVTADYIVPTNIDMVNNRMSSIRNDYFQKYLAEKDLNLTAILNVKAA